MGRPLRRGRRTLGQLGLPLEQAYARLREAECLLLDGERTLAQDSVAARVQITRQWAGSGGRDLDGLAARVWQRAGATGTSVRR